MSRDIIENIDITGQLLKRQNATRRLPELSSNNNREFQQIPELQEFKQIMTDKSNQTLQQILDNQMKLQKQIDEIHRNIAILMDRSNNEINAAKNFTFREVTSMDEYKKDTWSITYSETNTDIGAIDPENNDIMVFGSTKQTALFFGNTVVSEGVFAWKLQFNSVIEKGPDIFSSGVIPNVLVGIIEDFSDQDYADVAFQMSLGDFSELAYSLDNYTGELEDNYRCKKVEENEKQLKFLEDDDVLEIVLDMRKQKIWAKVNQDKQICIFQNIPKNKKYRLAIWCFPKKDSDACLFVSLL